MFFRLVGENAVSTRVEKMQAYDVGLKNMEQLQVLIQLNSVNIQNIKSSILNPQNTTPRNPQGVFRNHHIQTFNSERRQSSTLDGAQLISAT